MAIFVAFSVSGPAGDDIDSFQQILLQVRMCPHSGVWNCNDYTFALANSMGDREFQVSHVPLVISDPVDPVVGIRYFQGRWVGGPDCCGYNEQ